MLEAIDVLQQVASNFSAIPDGKSESLSAGLQVSITCLTLAELAKHLGDGMEPYDAYLATVRGDMPLDERSKMYYAMMPKGGTNGTTTACPCCGTLVPAEKINRDALKS